LEGEALSEASDVERAYGCVFCVAGKEEAIAHRIEQVCGNVRTVVARQHKRKSEQGKTRIEDAILFPGYVFFEAPTGLEAVLKFPKENVFSVLKTESGDWQLYGDDAKFAQWLFSYDGLIPFSKAYQEGDLIRIITGPLKDFEGWITHIDKRNKNGKVTVQFCNREISVWLGFEIVEKV